MLQIVLQLGKENYLVIKINYLVIEINYLVIEIREWYKKTR